MTPLQKFQIAFADYSAGFLAFDTLMACANEAGAEHPGYVAVLLQWFKMSKSAPAAPPPESKGLDLETIEADEARNYCDCSACTHGNIPALIAEVRRLRAGAEGGGDHG